MTVMLIMLLAVDYSYLLNGIIFIASILHVFFYNCNFKSDNRASLETPTTARYDVRQPSQNEQVKVVRYYLSLHSVKLG